jgi:hypothetical protein
MLIKNFNSEYDLNGRLSLQQTETAKFHW